MSRHSKNIKLLEKINNIDEECSEDDQEISDIEDDKAENDHDLFDNDSKIEKGDTHIPETISCYNSTKFGIDMTDQIARKNSIKSESRRWPLQVFFNILDLARINSWILYKETTGEKISSQEFLFQLAEELATEFQELQEHEIEDIKKISTNSSKVPYIRKTCQIKYCQDNKTARMCNKCKKYTCGKCTFENIIICKKYGEQ